jgi:hypothetical protein
LRSLLLIRRLPPLLSLEDTFVEDTGNTGTGSGSGTTLPDDGIPRSANAAVLEGSAMSSVMEVRLPGLRRRPRLPFLAATSAVSKLGSMGATMPRSRRAAELEGSPKIWSIELRFLFLLRRRLALSVGRAERVDGAKGRSEDMLRPFLARMFWTFPRFQRGGGGKARFFSLIKFLNLGPSCRKSQATSGTPKTTRPPQELKHTAKVRHK